VGVLVVDPLTNPDLYNHLNVGGVDNPGIFVLESDADRPYRWDVKNVAGAQGSTITYQGWDLAKPKGKFKFWLADQISEFYGSYLPLLSYDATKKAPKPVSVFHPVLFANDTINVVVDKIGQLTHEGQQLWSVAIELIEYRPAPKVNTTTTPKSADPGSSPAKPTVNDALDEAIANELAIARKPLPG
jgi:hypothetical protein